MAKMLVDAWYDTEFQGGRHQARVDMMMDIEKRQ
jgi:ribose 5-phosphate isomerase B